MFKWYLVLGSMLTGSINWILHVSKDYLSNIILFLAGFKGSPPIWKWFDKIADFVGFKNFVKKDRLTVKNVIFEILWEEIEQKPYNMLLNHLFQLLEHILTLLMVREASFVAQILLKMTQISAICGIFEEFEHSISQIEVSITPFGQFWCIKWSLTIWFGFLFLRVKLQDCGTLPSSPIRWTAQGFPKPSNAWKVSNPPILTSFKGQTMPIFNYFGQNTIFLHFFTKNR